MTTRSFDATDLVVLPRFAAAGAIALGASIESAAKEASKESPLPPPCASAAARVRETHEGLRKEFAKRVRSTSLSADELGRLDAGLDSAWAALSSVVAAHARAPFGPADQPLADAALRVQRALFGGGLKFTQLPYKLEWAESQARLDLVDDPSLAMDLSALQAGPVRRAHPRAARRVRRRAGAQQGGPARAERRHPHAPRSLQRGRSLVRREGLGDRRGGRRGEPGARGSAPGAERELAEQRHEHPDGARARRASDAHPRRPDLSKTRPRNPRAAVISAEDRGSDGRPSGANYIPPLAGTTWGLAPLATRHLTTVVALGWFDLPPPEVSARNELCAPSWMSAAPFGGTGPLLNS